MAKPKPKESYFKDILAEKKTKANTHFGNFKVSFQYLDSSQKYGSSYVDWQNDKLLSKTLETIQGYCCKPLLEQVDGHKFAIYGDFPPEGETLYRQPQHVPLDANWARIHINNISVVVGHILEDTFYIVFLDKSHKFWLSKKYRAKKDQ